MLHLLQWRRGRHVGVVGAVWVVWGGGGWAVSVVERVEGRAENMLVVGGERGEAAAGGWGR